MVDREVLSCPRCGGFRVDVSALDSVAVEQAKEAIVYHMKHSEVCL